MCVCVLCMVLVASLVQDLSMMHSLCSEVHSGSLLSEIKQSSTRAEWAERVSTNMYVLLVRTHTHAFIVRVALSQSTITGIVCRKLWLWKLPTIFRYRFLTIFQMGFFSFSDVHRSHHRRRWHHLTRAEAHRRRHLRWRTEGTVEKGKTKIYSLEPYWLHSAHTVSSPCDCVQYVICCIVFPHRLILWTKHDTSCMRPLLFISIDVLWPLLFLLFSLVIVRSIALFLFPSVRWAFVTVDGDCIYAVRNE